MDKIQCLGVHQRHSYMVGTQDSLSSNAIGNKTKFTYGNAAAFKWQICVIVATAVYIDTHMEIGIASTSTNFSMMIGIFIGLVDNTAYLVHKIDVADIIKRVRELSEQSSSNVNSFLIVCSNLIQRYDFLFFVHFFRIEAKCYSEKNL